MALPALRLQFKTYDDLQATPDDGRRDELIQGELFTSPSARRRHQIAMLGLYDALRAFLRTDPIGVLMVAAFDVKFSETTVVQPDLFVVRREREHIITDRFCDGPPDLAAEVLSPANRGYAVVRKAAIYLENRVPEYWVVDPAIFTVMVNVWRDGHYVPEPIENGVARSVVRPGFAVNASEIFNRDQAVVQSDEME